MLIDLPYYLSARLEGYAERKGTTPDRVLKNLIERLPGPARTRTCLRCGKSFYSSRNSLYCSRGCMSEVPFPRLGITWGDVQRRYGSTITIAAESLGVSRAQMERVVRKHGLRDRFETRGEYERRKNVLRER